MRPEKFDDLIRQVYATFGRAMPNGDVKAVIWDKVRDVPDEAVPFLADQLCNRDELPRNVARALSEAWGAWKSANPARIVREHCPHCLDEGVFHCWAQEPGNGRWHKFAVPCPYCQTPEDGSRVPAACLLQQLPEHRTGDVALPGPGSQLNPSCPIWQPHSHRLIEPERPHQSSPGCGPLLCKPQQK